MEISAKELRGKPGRIIELAERGTEIIITLRGKKKARLTPYQNTKNENSAKNADDNIFAMWADKQELEPVDSYVRSIRKGRSF